MSVELDTPTLLAALAAREVDFVVIGGMAAVIHGSPRMTHALDVSFGVDAENLQRLGVALISLRARLRGVADDVPFVPDARTLRGVDVLTLDTVGGPLDVLARPSGAPSYAELRRDAVRYALGTFEIRVASIAHLIAMKRAAGRLKDLADIAELEAIARLDP